jgi:hypothetical protein
MYCVIMYIEGAVFKVAMEGGAIGVHGCIILEGISQKQDGRSWTGLIGFRIKTVAGCGL